MKQQEKQNRLKQFFTKKNIAILATATVVCISAAIAIPLCVLSEQTIPVSRESSEIASYIVTENSSEESIESIESIADTSLQEESSEHAESVQESAAQHVVEQNNSIAESTAKIQPCTHLYTKNVIPATCSSQGYTVHTCQNAAQLYRFLCCPTA